MISQNKRLTAILISIPLLLLIPLIAMQFNTGVNWKAGDFIIMGALLTGAGLLCELALRRFRKKAYRYLFIAILIIAFLLIWAELAVGIFGTPLAGN